MNPPSAQLSMFDQPTTTALALVSCTHHPTLQPEFDMFWRAYPRRVGKGAAHTAFVGGGRKSKVAGAFHRAGGLEPMLTTLALWVPYWNEIGLDKCPHPATWLNRDGWHDDPPVRRRVERRYGTQDQALLSVAHRLGVGR